MDIFFRSLGLAAGKKAIAVVLSGTGSDGSRGVADVHASGGLVLAQNEDSAKFDGMPRAAINTGFVDYELPPEQLAKVIANHLTSDGQDQSKSQDANRGRYAAILRLLRREYGIDFSHYRPLTVERRIERRLSMGEDEGISEYSRRLANDPAELNAMYRDLLIGVTHFFRDEEAFKALNNEVLPALLTTPEQGQELRVWVAGCATGEEAYSLAILLDEHRRTLDSDLGIRLFATDVHRTSLDFAARGLYDDERMKGVSEERLDRYFHKVGGSYQVSKDLRKMVVFAPHNLLKDAPFTNLDLVACRNLLIYFRPRAQKRALSLMHFGLRTGGYLLLGPSESTGDLESEFEPVNRQWRIFRKQRDIRLPSELRLPLPMGVSSPEGADGESRRAIADLRLMRAYDFLLARHMPPTFLIDENRKLIHSFSGAGRFLEVRDGRPSSDLLGMVCDDLRNALASALGGRAAVPESQFFRNVRIRSSRDDQLYQIMISPVSLGSSDIQYTSVTIEPETPAEGIQPEEAHFDMDEVAANRIQELERELAYTKENLQATVEEMEATNQELQATNEEMVAANEELQSTNEELHSVNEELHTVNAEHQRKIEELTQLTDDMDNLLSSTEVGTIFVDREMKIRRFTPKIANTFHLAGQDIGRTIDTFSHTLDHANLVDDIQSVLRTSQPLEYEVQDTKKNWYLMRITPYRSQGLTQGAVLSLVDISNLKASQSELAATEEKYEDLYNNAPDMYVTVDAGSRRIIECNQTTADRLGYAKDEIAGRLVTELYHPDSRSSAKLEFDKFLRKGETSNVELVLQDRNGRSIPVSLNASAIRDSSGEIIRTRSVWRDISRLKKARSELRQREESTRSILESALDAIITIDHTSTVTRWNPQAEQVFGYSSEEAVGRQLPELVIPQDQREAHAIGMKRYLVTGEGVVQGKRLELQAIRKSGEEFPVELTVVANRSSDQIHDEFTAFVRDITERRQAEVEIQQAVVRRDQFLAMLSHELRNPLNAVLNAVYVMERQGGDAETLAASQQVVRRQSSQMGRLLDDLLDVSRVTQGKIDVRLEPLSLSQTTEEACSVLEPRMKKLGQQLRVDLPDEPLYVRGDPARLQQVQVNLLNNASKYSPDGSKIELSLRREGDVGVIRVRDEGAGIPRETLDSIFDMFVQNSGTRDRAAGGMGIGLTLARSLVELHNGEISAKSDGVGRGSEFEVRLPLIDRSVSKEAAEDVDAEGTGGKIVLIEDNDDARLMLKKMLEMDNYQVLDASDGLSGVELIESIQPSIAIVDIGLPGIDGLEVASRIRDKFTSDEIKLVALTGYGQSQDHEAVLAAGFDEHLVKPLQPMQLADVLKRYGK